MHYAAFVAQNQQHELTPGVDQLDSPTQLVDVRSEREFARGSLARAVNIPLDELRSRHHQLDPNKPTIVFCEVGIRGHLATRILKQHGFKDVRNLKGGYVQAHERFLVRS